MKNINSLYSAKVMDHFNHPRNVGEIAGASGMGTVGNKVCGDVMRLYIKVSKGTKVSSSSADREVSEDKVPRVSRVPSTFTKVSADRRVPRAESDQEIITDAKFQTLGCGAAIATSSIATEMIIGKPVDEALELTNQAITEALDGLPPTKIHCSVLAAEAVKKAVEDYRSKISEGSKVSKVS